MDWKNFLRMFGVSKIPDGERVVSYYEEYIINHDNKFCYIRCCCCGKIMQHGEKCYICNGIPFATSHPICIGCYNE